MGSDCLDDRVPFRRSGRSRSRVPKFWILVAAVACYGLSYVVVAGRAKNRGVDAGGDTVWAFRQLRPAAGAPAHERLAEKALFVVFYPLIRVDRALGYLHVLDGGAERL